MTPSPRPKTTHTPEPRRCRECGALFDAKLDHNGRLGGVRRQFCTIGCRDTAQLARRKVKRAKVSAHRKANAGLIALHDEEARGQLPLPVCEPLPPVPPLEVSA